MKVKVGDILISKLKKSNNFTYDKPYNIISIAKINDFDSIIRILNDNSDIHEISSKMIEHMFKTTQDLREEKLKQIGI
jgi:hypothetical protein